MVVEHQAVIAGSAIAVWALARVWRRPERWRLVGLAVAGGAAAALPFLLYNLAAFGTVFRLGYQGVVGFEGMNQGLFGLTLPSPGVLWEVLFGSRRGLLWVAPVLLFGAIGLWLGWRLLPAVLLVACLVGLGVVGWRLLTRRPVTPADQLPLARADADTNAPANASPRSDRCCPAKARHADPSGGITEHTCRPHDACPRSASQADDVGRVLCGKAAHAHGE